MILGLRFWPYVALTATIIAHEATLSRQVPTTLFFHSTLMQVTGSAGPSGAKVLTQTGFRLLHTRWHNDLVSFEQNNMSG